MTKKLKVIMLPQNGVVDYTTGNIMKWKDGTYTISRGEVSTELPEPQHMYLVDESAPIKRGDSIINDGEYDICDMISERGNIGYGGHTLCGDDDKPYKVIATTKPNCGLPNIPLSAIEKWIEQPYDYVEVEMGYKDRWSKLLVEEQHEPIELHTQIKVVDGYVVPVFDITTVLSDERQYLREYNETGYSKEDLQRTVGEAARKAAYEVESTREDHENDIAVIFFQVGADWKEQQIGNDTIEFANWLLINYVNTINNEWRTISSDKTYSTQELYNIYKQSKQ